MTPQPNAPRRARRWPPGRAGGGGQRGSATLELAVLAPALLVVLGLVVTAGRIAICAGAVEEAARDAARQASLARDPTTASRTAAGAARGTLARQGLRCAALSVTVDTGGFAVPVGQPAQVGANVTCTVALADVAAPGTPGTRTLRASFTSPLDRYRERG